MFKSIKGQLSRKHSSLQQQLGAAMITQKVVKEFVRQNYPEADPAVFIGYNEQTRVLVIRAPRKSLAAVLLLSTTDIRAQLTQAGVRVSQISIR